MKPATAKQARPSTGKRDITRLVKADLEARAQIGKRIYGRRLQSFNGRNPLWDAYQEVLDLAVYLRQEIEEREASR